MSNKVWDQLSYNESYFAEMDRLRKGWEELMKERPIEDQNYQPVVNHESTHPEKLINGSDIY